MSFRIIINELGKIRNSSVEFKPFLIFSGESNSGKSYTAFLIYHLIRLFEFNISSINLIVHHFDDFIEYKYKSYADKIQQGESVQFPFLASDFIQWFDSTAHKYVGNLIGYENIKCDIHLEANLNDFEVQVDFPSEESSKLQDNKLPPNVIFKIRNETFSAGVEYTKTRATYVLGILIGLEIRKQLFNIQENAFNRFFVPILLPPSRGSLIHGSPPYSTIGMYKDFLDDLADAKIQDPLGKPDSNSYLDEILESLFQGNISVVDGELEYHINSTEKIPIAAAASSIKELSPLFLIIKKYQTNSLSILFEEPEAHLHPTLQQKVALLLTYIINNGGFIQTTTHSDYLLSQIRNLVRLDLLKKKKGEAHSSIINKLEGINENMCLDISKVGAYCFQKQSDGYVKIVPQINNEGEFKLDTFDKAVEKMISENELINEGIDSL